MRQAEPSGLRRYVSVLEGIRPYKRDWPQTDIIAGINPGRARHPEVMGYTQISGMPIVTGLYTILVPMAAFALLGSSRHLVVGADSATAAVIRSKYGRDEFSSQNCGDCSGVPWRGASRSRRPESSGSGRMNWS